MHCLKGSCWKYMVCSSTLCISREQWHFHAFPLACPMYEVECASGHGEMHFSKLLSPNVSMDGSEKRQLLIPDTQREGDATAKV